MLVVGLTGGMGSGKTTVSNLFAELGVPVIDTDLIGRQLTDPGSEVLDEVRTMFTDEVMHADGTLDRAALRRLVFKDTPARRRLEALLHPRIRKRVGQDLALLDVPYSIVVIPLLVEAGGYQDVLDRVLVIDCPQAMQVERVMLRSDLSRDEVEAMLATQASREKRLAVANDVILNTTTPDVLRTQVIRLHQHYGALANSLLP